MKILLFIAGCLLDFSGVCQTDAPATELTPALEAKIWRETDALLPQFKKALEGQHLNPAQIEFSIDTSRVSAFMSRCIKLNHTDAGMSYATYAGAARYDTLMNKYYKKLAGVLKAADKTVLTQAQRAWLTFRDSETKLVELIARDEYSGGGTLQQLTNSGEYLDLIKSRVQALFDHYTRATRAE